MESMSRVLLDAMIGQPCWHVSAGGPTAPSFVLVMGDKVARETPLRNQSQPEAFRKHRGSVELLVWSSWRLQTGSQVLASSDQGDVGLEELDRLTGATVTKIDCVPPAWDLHIEFSNDLVIVTFSDHVEPGASIAANWELWALGRYLRTGPGSSWQEEAAPDASR